MYIEFKIRQQPVETWNKENHFQFKFVENELIIFKLLSSKHLTTMFNCIFSLFICISFKSDWICRYAFWNWTSSFNVFWMRPTHFGWTIKRNWNLCTSIEKCIFSCKYSASKAFILKKVLTIMYFKQIQKHF